MAKPAYRELSEDDPTSSIFLVESPVRIWHWLNAVAVVALTVTGYIIGTPPPSYTGDPSTVYVMGWVRLVHLAGGHLFALLWIMRIWWAIVGNSYARLLFVPPFWNRSWTSGIVHHLAWNLFLTSRISRYVGINPLAHLTMLVTFVLPSALLIITGYAMYAEVTGHESWYFYLFGWTTNITANTIDLHTIHRVCMWVVLWFAMLHTYTAVVEDVNSRQTMVSTMLSGFRSFKR